MKVYSQIDRNVHNEKAFHCLSDDAKLLYFGTRCHSQQTPLGMFRASIRSLAAEYSWGIRRMKAAIKSLENASYIEHDDAACCLIIPDWFDLNRPTNPNMATNWGKYVAAVPDCDLKAKQLARLKGILEGLGESFLHAFGKALTNGYAEAFLEGFGEGFGEGLGDPSPNPEPEPEPEQEEEKKPVNEDFNNTHKGGAQENNPGTVFFEEKGNEEGEITEKDGPAPGPGAQDAGTRAQYRFQDRIDLIVSYFRKRSGKKKRDYEITPDRHAILVKRLHEVQKKFEAAELEGLQDVRFFALAIEGKLSEERSVKGGYDGLCEYVCPSIEKMEIWVSRARHRKIQLEPLTTEEQAKRKRALDEHRQKIRLLEEKKRLEAAARDREREIEARQARKTKYAAYRTFLAERKFETKDRIQKRIWIEDFLKWETQGLPPGFQEIEQEYEEIMACESKPMDDAQAAQVPGAPAQDPGLTTQDHVFAHWLLFKAGELITDRAMAEKFRDWQEGDKMPAWLRQRENLEAAKKRMEEKGGISG